MLDLKLIDSLEQVPAELWNGLTGTDYPFLRHEFLLAMEQSKATTEKSGWQPHHALLYRGDTLIALLPLYLKYHSYGEYVFDWGWADAFERAGGDYYPKLLSAIPYSPVTGPRFCVAAGESEPELLAAVLGALQEHAETQHLSSLHLLFPRSEVSESLNDLGASQRLGVQYHWFNQGYQSFDDFLARFSSRKRKNLRKERQRVVDQGIELRRLSGNEISESEWQTFFRCYQLTYAKRSGHGGYLDAEFFHQLGESMGEQLMMVIARHNGQDIACALNLCSSETLYGRYWGCLKEFEFLHFEACYYQGIEHCIERGLKRFDPGAQGEHKIQRGFTPITTYSNHWISDPRFRHAVEDFLRREFATIPDYLRRASELLPFKQIDQ